MFRHPAWNARGPALQRLALRRSIAARDLAGRPAAVCQSCAPPDSGAFKVVIQLLAKAYPALAKFGRRIWHFQTTWQPLQKQRLRKRSPGCELRPAQFGGARCKHFRKRARGWGHLAGAGRASRMLSTLLVHLSQVY